jgi:hypothetical protein
MYETPYKYGKTSNKLFGLLLLKFSILYNCLSKILSSILTTDYTMSESITMNILKLKEWIGT